MGHPGEPYDPNLGYPPAALDATQFGEPQYPQPQYGQPQYQQPQYGQPQYGQPQYGQPQYGQPQYQQPQYGQPQYGQAQYGQPGYPMPGYQMSGYPMPGYGGPPRPAGLTAAAVLAYVAAGLLIFAGILLFFGASVINSFDAIDGGTASGGMLTAELAFDGLLNLLSGGLLISGAVMFTGGRATGRVLMSIGCGIVIVESIYWALRTGGNGVAWSVLFAAIVIVALSLAWTAGATRWLTQVAAAVVRH